MLYTYVHAECDLTHCHVLCPCVCEVFREAFLEHLDMGRIRPGGLLELLPRNAVSDDLRKKFLKTADALQMPPWGMMNASEYLRTWCANSQSTVQCKEKLWPLPFVTQPLDPNMIIQPLAFHWEDFARAEAPNQVVIEHRRIQPGAKWTPKPRPAPKGTAAASSSAPRKRTIDVPDGVTLGCGKCRKSPTGCVRCRAKAGFVLVDGKLVRKEESRAEDYVGQEDVSALPG